MKYKGFSYSKAGWNLQMMPIGYLMIEHRLIERMIRLLTGQLSRIGEKNKTDLNFLEVAIDFIKTYADKCHHGNEEDILFKELAKKQLSPTHRKVMQELIEEHKMGRGAVAELVEAKDDYAKGNLSALGRIKGHIKWLIEFYPRHIAKEDKESFIPFMSYFTRPQQDNMVLKFLEFDQNGVQDTYRNIVQKLEKQFKEIPKI